MGTGLSGDLRYVIGRANNDPGSTIDFSVAGTIQLASALPSHRGHDHQRPRGGEFDRGPQRHRGDADFSIFTVDADVQAMIAGLTISGGLSGQRAAASTTRALTVNASTIVNNSDSVAASRTLAAR